MCVCSAACRRTHTSHHPKIWRGLLFSPGLGTEPGGDPKCWPPGVPPIVTPSEKPWRVKNWKGASKQKLLLGVGLPDTIYFRGAHPNPGAAGSTPPKGVFALRILRGPANKKCSSGWVCSVKFYLWGFTPTPGPQGPPCQMRVYALRILRGPANKSCSSGWVCMVKFYLWGAHPNPWPAGSTPPNKGICIENWEKASKQKLLFGVGLPGKILFVGGSPQLGARRVLPTKCGYTHWELREGQQTKVAPRGRFTW